MTFGDRLKEARNKKHLTQEQLANELGIAKSTLAGYEKGNREPDVFKIKKIIEILDIDADYLLGIEKTSSSDNSDEEASVQNIMEELTNLFVRSGYIEPGGDLTDDQLRFCIGVIDMFNAYFDNSNKL